MFGPMKVVETKGWLKQTVFVNFNQVFFIGAVTQYSMFNNVSSNEENLVIPSSLQ